MNQDNQIYFVHKKYDFVESEIKLLHKGDYLNFLVKPFKKDSTKVTMKVMGKKVC